MRRRFRFLLALVLLAGWFGPAGPARAASPPRLPVVRPRGDQAFRLMLHFANLRPLGAIKGLRDQPGRKILIIFGDPGVLKDFDAELGEGGLRNFLINGGAVLIASDRGGWGVLSVSPAGERVLSREPNDAFEQNLGFPFLTHFDTNHPLFRGVNRLATGHPSFLTGDFRGVRIPAEFEADKVDVKTPGERGDVRPPDGNLPFAAAWEGKPGRILILAGHGLFLNRAMANRTSSTDTDFTADNVVFTHNCLTWLADTKGGRPRDQVLFIEDGRIITKFDVPLTEMPRLPLPTVDQINRLLSRLEAENFFNRVAFALLGRNAAPEDQVAAAHEVVARVVVVLLALLLFLYGLRRLWKARHRLEVRVPLVGRGPVPEALPGPLVEQRHRDLLGQGNFWETARELARQCFADYADHSAVQPPHPPEVEASGGWWERRGLDRQVRELWQLAYGDQPRAVSAGQLARLAVEADRVKAALASGALIFHEPARGPAVPRPGHSPTAG